MCEFLFRIAIWTIYTRNIFSLVLLKIFQNLWNTSRKKSAQKQLFSGVVQDRYPEKLLKFHKKTPALESIFHKVFRNKKTPAEVFSCEFCETFKNTFFYRPPLVELEVVFKKVLHCRCSQKGFWMASCKWILMHQQELFALFLYLYFLFLYF